MSINLSRFISKLLIVLIAFNSILGASGISLYLGKPSNSVVIDILTAEVELDYRGLFKLNNFTRINGYWIDKNNGEYRIECTYELIAQKVIVPKRYMSDVALFYRLNHLRFNSDISKGEAIFQTDKINLRQTENGWKKFNNLKTISIF